MLHILFSYLHLFYIVFTESLFVKIFAILMFYFFSLYLKTPTKDWYSYTDYDQMKDTDA